MNQLISIAELTIQSLSTGVLHLLKNELGEHGTVVEVGNKILISISKVDFEQRLGSVLQQIYRAVDQHFPDRKEFLSIIIRNADDQYENTFKIWPTA